MLVVDDHPLLTGGLVGTQVLVNTPVAAPLAQNTTTATAHRNNSMYRLETRNNSVYGRKKKAKGEENSESGLEAMKRKWREV